jgi:hypothetical protein
MKFLSQYWFIILFSLGTISSAAVLANTVQAHTSQLTELKTSQAQTQVELINEKLKTSLSDGTVRAIEKELKEIKEIQNRILEILLSKGKDK